MKKNSQAFGMSIIGVLFFIFGFVTWLNSVLIPFLKSVCQLSDFKSYFVTFAFYISYFVMALPASSVLKRTGFIKGMSLGLVVMGVGSLLFIPAALQRDYTLFLVGLFAQGTGLALLQTASNPYVTILGPIDTAARRMSIMGICNKVAGMIGVLLLSQLLFSDVSHTAEALSGMTDLNREMALTTLSHKIIAPYIVMAVILFALAGMIFFAKLPEVQPETTDTSDKGSSLLKGYPYFWLGVVALFLYVGAEVVAIDTLSLYGTSVGMSALLATKLGTFSLIALTLGYLLGIVLIPKVLSQRDALIYCNILNIVLLIAAVLSSGITSVIFVILLSFGHAIMWPAIWPLAINKLGRHTEVGSAVLIMGIAGGAILPLLYGRWADSVGTRQIPYLILIPCYLFILFFALHGYRIGLKDGCSKG